MRPSEQPRTSSLPLLIVAWLVVGIPAAWGVGQTITKSLQLFTAGPAAATQPVK